MIYRETGSLHLAHPSLRSSGQPQWLQVDSNWIIMLWYVFMIVEKPEHREETQTDMGRKPRTFLLWGNSADTSCFITSYIQYTNKTSPYGADVHVDVKGSVTAWFWKSREKRSKIKRKCLQWLWIRKTYKWWKQVWRNTKTEISKKFPWGPRVVILETEQHTSWKE